MKTQEKTMSYRDSKGTTQPMVHALIAGFVALGCASGRENLNRASHILRNIAADPRTEADTSAILQDIVMTVEGMSS